MRVSSDEGVASSIGPEAKNRKRKTGTSLSFRGNPEKLRNIPAFESRSLRAEFFRRKWAAADAESIERLAAATDRLSFAHLQEILRLSGLFAIQAGRHERTIHDLMKAVRSLRGTQDDVTRGFAARPEVPFGLASWRNR